MILLQSREGRKFGNAREARKLFDDTLRKQQKRLNNERKKSNLSNEQISNLMKSFVTNDIEEAILFLNSDLHPQIDFYCSSEIVQQPDIPVSIKNESITIPEEKHVETEKNSEKNLNPPKETEAAIKGLLYDYCIIDTNIWMETHDIKTHHKYLEDLKDYYKQKGNKLVAHGSTHEELKKFSDAYWKKIEEKDKGLNPKIHPKEYCGSKGFSLLKRFFKDNIVRIPGLKSIHDKDAYADKDIYEFASEEYQKGKSILFITNDNDCGMRVSSRLEDLKSNNHLLPIYEILDMKQTVERLNNISKK